MTSPLPFLPFMVGLATLLATRTHAQSNPDFGVGLSLQVYPTGQILGPTADWWTERNRFQFRVAYNRAERDDNGDHDDESGGGPGIGVAWHRLNPIGRSGRDIEWYYGARLDVWGLEIDWKDKGATGPDKRGSTDVTVLQPTAELGLRIPLQARWDLNLSIAGGAEINVDTDGEDVGEGAIGLVGANLVYRF